MHKFRLAILLLTCLALLCAQAGLASAVDPAVWQRNGYAVASNGSETYFLLRQNNAWHLQSARRALAKEPPIYALPNDTLPYGFLYADEQNIWYARYSATLREEQPGKGLRAALEFVCYDLTTGQETLLVRDADPNSLFPLDGTRLGYLPWGDPSSLATLDFSSRTDLLVLQTSPLVIWDVTEVGGAMYLILVQKETEREALYRIQNGAIAKLDAPIPEPAVSWFQGNHRVYSDANGTFYAAPLSDPANAHPLEKAGGQKDVYYFGDHRYLCEVNPDNVATLYRLPLAKDEEIRMLEFDALAQPFVRGHDGDEMVTMDRAGRLLSITGEFTKLEQVAQLDAEALLAEAQWLWALPFEEYIVMLGYSHGGGSAGGLSLPPDRVRVVPRGEGM